MTPLTKPVHRLAAQTLDGSFGPDRGRHLTITLVPGNGGTVPDMIVLRPHGTRRAERIAAIDVYRFALRCRANRETLEKARDRKARKAERLASQRVARFDKRLKAQLRKEREE